MAKKRFTVIDKQGKMSSFKVVRDNHTGVLYMSHNSGYQGGLTVMFDRDGKPLIDENYEVK